MKLIAFIWAMALTGATWAQAPESSAPVFIEEEIPEAPGEKKLNFKSFVDDIIKDIDANSEKEQEISAESPVAAGTDSLEIADEETAPAAVSDVAPSEEVAPGEEITPPAEDKSFLTQDQHPNVTKDNWVSEKEFTPPPPGEKLNVAALPTISENTILLDESPRMLDALQEISETPEKDVVLIFASGYDYYDIVKPNMIILAPPGTEKLNDGLEGRVTRVTLNTQNDLVVELEDLQRLPAEKAPGGQDFPVVVADINKHLAPELSASETLAEALARHKARAKEKNPVTVVYDRNVPFPEKVSILPNKLSKTWRDSYNKDRETVLNNEKDVALKTPSQGKFVNGAVFYDYSPNSKYLVYLTTDLASVIHLEPGEYPVVAPVITNPGGFNVKHTSYGTALGKDPVSHVLVINAQAANTNGSLIVTTNRRIYHFIIQTTEGFATQIVKFNWPRPVEFNLPVQKRAEDLRPPTASPRSPSAPTSGRAKLKPYERGVLASEMQFKYETQTGCDHGHECSAFQRQQSEKLVPDIIFDDQEYTYFIWHSPPKHAPILLSLTPGDEQKIINYNVRENMYVAQGVFDQATIMLDSHTFVLVKNRNLEVKNHG